MKDSLQKKRGRPKIKESVPKKQLTSVACEWCGEVFTPRNKSNIYCSKDCSSQKIHNDKEVRNRARFIIFERDQFKCVYCGQSSIEHGVSLVVDHIIPESAGGDSGIYNVVTSCYQCNLVKANRILEESVYLRIIERNKAFNDSLTPLRKAFIEKVITEIKRLSKSKWQK